MQKVRGSRGARHFVSGANSWQMVMCSSWMRSSWRHLRSTFGQKSPLTKAMFGGQRSLWTNSGRPFAGAALLAAGAALLAAGADDADDGPGAGAALGATTLATRGEGASRARSAQLAA